MTKRLFSAKIERATPDDEIVGRGFFHMERMDSKRIWFSLGDHHFWLSSRKPIHWAGDWPK